jgi:hypothetical protein
MLRKRFRARFRLPRLENLDPWGIMWNRITNEEANIADHVWMNLSEENQEALRDSQVIPDVLSILVLSRDRRMWIQNPVLSMLKYAFVIQLLQPPNWAMYFVTIQNWISEFRLLDLESQPPESEIQAQLQAVQDQVEKSRIRWRSIQH